MKRKKFGKGLAIFLLLILFIVLGYLLYTYFYGGTEEQKRERKLTKMAKSFYEDYYYGLLEEEKGSNDKVVIYLSNFADTGLKISFDSLKLYYDENGNMNYSEFADCDENNTIVKIYPKAPYTNKDYTIKVQLSCDKEESNNDSKKFKEEYEKLNGTESLNEVNLEENNLVNYATLKEINKMIEDKESFVVVFGSPYYNESRFSISQFIEVSKENGIDKIYFIDLIKDGKVENDIRTEYTLNDGVVTKTSEGSEDYSTFIISAQDILPIPYEDFIDVNTYEGSKTILNSAYIFVENGIPTIYTDGLPKDTQDYSLVDSNTIKEIFKDFYNKRKTN